MNPLLTLSLTGCAVGLLLFGAVDATAEEPTPLETATADLDMLEDLLDDRDAMRDDLTTYLNVVKKAVLQLEEGDPDDIEDFREDALDQFLEALRETDEEHHRNQREPVNVAAAHALIAVAPKISEREKRKVERKIKRTISRLHDAKDYEPTQRRLEVTFATLPAYGDHDTLEWLLDEYAHTRKREADFLVAAHKAMLMFENVPGELRHAIVEEFIVRYTGVETLANTSTNDPGALAKKRFWDRIRIHTVAVVQYYAGYPKDANGAAINTMKGFQDWFRDVKRRSAEPWQDPVD